MTSVDAFVRALQAASSASTKPLVRSTLYTVPGTADDEQAHELLSWKAQEFAYRQFSQDSDELPTLARGLFTEQVGEAARIVARGYDKFFNVGELAWTRPAAVAAYSSGPYIVSYKENGCIIFVAALTPHRLVVTSKHAIGSRGDMPDDKPSHSEKGREWLAKHLAAAGRTEEQLAQELWRRNETAVLELCDDSFEEHVLAYPPERTGLHLHGLNANAVEFRTRSMDEVNVFAADWGFIPVRYRTFDTWEQVDAFSREVGRTGSLDGEPIEGFVVRTQVPPVPGAVPDGAVQPPYRPGQTWFFKIKFDEPYLMYRDWRELTRSMLAEKRKFDDAAPPAAPPGSAADKLSKGVENVQLDGDTPAEGGEPPAELIDAERDFAAGKISKKALKRVQKQFDREAQRKEKASEAAERAAGRRPPLPPTPRSNRPETQVYVQWCWDRLYGNAERGVAPEPALFAEFNQGRGIIALREAFLHFLQTDEGKRQLGDMAPAARDLRSDTRPFGKTLIVPIAVPGCGKTALAVALSHLFGWAHVQSDDVQTKRTGPAFLRNVEEALRAHDVVIADRNNHLLQHRDEFVELVRRFSGPQKNGPPGPRVRLVALAWQLDGLPHSAVQHVCATRIVDRGDRHQCLRIEAGARPSSGFEYDAVLTRFLKDMDAFQGVQSGEGSLGAADDQFSETVWLRLEDTLESSLDKTLALLLPTLQLPRPDTAAIEAALQAARTYSPAVRKPLPKMTPSSTGSTEVSLTSYLGVAVHMDLAAVVTQILDQHPDVPPYDTAKKLLRTIQAKHRLVQQPHITLVHVKDLEKNPEAMQPVWDQLYAQAIKLPGERPTFTMTVDALAWDDEVMAFGVKALASDAFPSLAQMLSHKPLDHLHITVGTSDEYVRFYEANRLFTGKQTVHTERLEGIPATGVLSFRSNRKSGP